MIVGEPVTQLPLPPLPTGFIVLSAAELRVMHALAVLGACGYPALRAETSIPDMPLRATVRALEFRNWVRLSRKGPARTTVVSPHDTGFARGFEQVGYNEDYRTERDRRVALCSRCLDRLDSRLAPVGMTYARRWLRHQLGLTSQEPVAAVAVAERAIIERMAREAETSPS